MGLSVDNDVAAPVVVFKTETGKHYVRYTDGIMQSISGPEFGRFEQQGALAIDPFDSQRLGNVIDYSDDKKKAMKKLASD